MTENESNQATLIETMKAGMQTTFWAELVRLTEENIRMLEAEIVTKIDTQTGKELTDAEVDKRRDKRSAMEDLINLPEQIVHEVTREEEEGEEHDPYAKTTAELYQQNTGGEST